MELFKEKLAELSLLPEAELDKKVHAGEIIINDYLVLLKKEKKCVLTGLLFQIVVRERFLVPSVLLRLRWERREICMFVINRISRILLGM